ncbi:MAG: ribosome biogenesis GTPase YlqF [Erysipelotrichaceae bacterium]|jgi:ribosome biogenesis GTPase A|nr:ribosome biogenesis GTPase YlqF [Erysipelotrichaceae bacterium]
MSEKAVNINWYPGHMAKARRLMEEQLKLVDIIIELRDARIPAASANPILKELSRNKPVLIILNKADLSDEAANKRWANQFEHCLIVDSLNENLSKRVVEKVKEILKDKLERAKAKGIRKKVLRAMVVGIPNVGKSTFINNIVRKKVAKAENRPGVTKSLQWIRINEDVELLDTPGVLWPKLENQDDARLLALIGSINDDVLDKEDLVYFALNYLRISYPGVINKRYEVAEDQNDLLEAIARKKLWLLNNNEINREKAVDQLLKDIRSSKIGRISWQDVRE